jgi:hypothetical protein
MNINGTIIYHNYIIFEKSLFTHLNYNVYENVVLLISYEVEIISDIEFINNLIIEYPNSIESLNNVKNRLNVRDNAKKLIYDQIKNKYLQNDKFWQNNFINDLYKLFNVNDINICVNFNKIQINKTQEKSICQHVDEIFLIIRTYLYNFPIHLHENNNYVLYKKLGYLQDLTLKYLNNNNKQLPSDDIFKNFNDEFEKKIIRKGK